MLCYCSAVMNDDTNEHNWWRAHQHTLCFPAFTGQRGSCRWCSKENENSPISTSVRHEDRKHIDRHCACTDETVTWILWTCTTYLSIFVKFPRHVVLSALINLLVFWFYFSTVLYHLWWGAWINDLRKAEQERHKKITKTARCYKLHHCSWK